MIWSADQQHMLGAMGFEVLLRPTADVSSAAPGKEAAVATSSRRAAPDRAAPVTTASRPAVPASGGQSAVDAAALAGLQQALRRAAGGADVSSLAVDLARLRREPSLKRALWPALRALRRSH